MTDLYRIVYTSRNLVGGEGDAQGRTVAGIVDVSLRNNGRAGVTGVLLFGTDRFAQLLEGPRAAVEATFERIQGDTRHGDISVLRCEPVAERVFSGWSMAFVGGSERGRALWDSLARSTGFDLGRVEGDGVCAALLAMVRGDEAGAEVAAPAPRTPGLDVERLRSALDAGRPGPRAAPAADGRAAGPSPRPAPVAEEPTPAAPSSAERVLRSALDAERERTTALRRELDAAHVALARSEGETEGLGRHRDIWADRSAQMRTSLHDLQGALRTAEAERDILRAHAAAHDGTLGALRAQRDVWAERARALAAAFCREPVLERDEAAPAGATRPAPERTRTPLAKVAS